MSEPIYLPTPVALIVENMMALQNAYTGRRKMDGADAAFIHALGDVLDQSSLRLFLDVISGRSADFGFYVDIFDGPAFGRDSRQNFENTYQVTSEYQRRLDRRPNLGIVDLAEDLATDPALAGLFLEANDESVAQEVVKMLVAKSDEAITTVGRKVKLDQAMAAIGRLGDKAAAATRAGSQSALAQARWCVVLRDLLNRERRR